MKAPKHPAPTRQKVLLIKPSKVWQLWDLGEIWQYRDLFFFLVWREIKVLYAQSILGIGWAIIRPFMQMIVFSVVFGKLAKINSDGVPYAIFSYTALVPWTYFSSALTAASNSLIGSAGMLGKVYFPRIIIPIAPTFSKLVDFLVASVLLAILMAYYKVSPNWNALTLPLLILIMLLTALGAGMWLAALAVQYRDVKYGISFASQLVMYCSPVVYPVSLIPQKYHLLYALNPMVGVIEGFRSGLLGTVPMPWHLVGVGSITAMLLFVSGTLYFHYKQRIFADVV